MKGEGQGDGNTHRHHQPCQLGATLTSPMSAQAAASTASRYTDVFVKKGGRNHGPSWRSLPAGGPGHHQRSTRACSRGGEEWRSLRRRLERWATAAAAAAAARAKWHPSWEQQPRVESYGGADGAREYVCLEVGL